MQQYDNTNTGIISKNDRKETDKHPDIKGSCEPQCPNCGKTSEMWINGWHKKRKDGSGSFYSLSFKAKENKTQEIRNEVLDDNQLDDDIPF